MCGIVAEYHPGGRVDPAALGEALKALRPRGPDGEGRWISANGDVGLGHVRLAILDLEGSSQPIASEDGQIILTVNGEFYDHEAVRRALERRGHRFRTGGDSEIALHLYEEAGLGFLDQLRGEFALVLWDGRHGQLVAARDRFGIKPLCFHQIGGRLLLASRAKALFRMGVVPAWDEEAFFQIASTQYLPPERTLFAGVRQLRAGHYLVANGNGVRVGCYWDMDYPSLADRPPAQDSAVLARQLRETLEEAVRLRLRADVPVCCHLSGGLDSSAVAGLAARHLARPLACFSVGFDITGYDELTQAEQAATQLGVDWHPLPLGQAVLAEHLADAVWHSEGLGINGHLSAKYLLARAIRAAGYKVVLSGEGSDEILGGYAHLRQDLFQADSRAGTSTYHQSDAILAGMHLPEGEALPMDHVARRLGYVPTFLHAKATLGRRMHGLLRDAYLARFGQRDPLADFLGAFDVPGRLAGRHLVDQSSYLWSHSALASYILHTLGDGTEMAHGIEGRLPFLDHHVFDLVRHYPIAVKIRGDVEKWILRQALADLLPRAVVERRKLPFTAPPLSLFRAAGTSLLEDTLRSTLLEDMEFFDPPRVRSLLDQLPTMGKQQRLAWDPVLMLVLTACLAQQRFGM
jgi:asparagine synthase (glutamine-hydrolysing)